MSANTPRYDLDTDITLGGENPSDQTAVSQKAVKYYIDHSSGGIIIDDELSTTSANPVQNKVITQAIENISLAKNPNLNLIGGNLNIDSGNVSGFSTTDYMQFPFVFNFNGYTWTLEMGFTAGLNVTTQQNILDSYYGVAFAINNGKFLMALSSNGSLWDIGSTSGTYSVQANTAYSVKIAWDGTKYTLSYALDETNYTTDITISSSVVHHSTQEYVGGEPELFGAGSQHPFTGTINLNNWKLTVNGLEVWLGMDDVGLGSRANIDLSNLTEAGLAKFQTPLVSGTNIKTINNESILGSGNINIQSGGTVDQTFNGTSANAQSGVAIQGELENYVPLSSQDDIEIQANNINFSTYGGKVTVESSPILVQGSNPLSEDSESNFYVDYSMLEYYDGRGNRTFYSEPDGSGFWARYYGSGTYTDYFNTQFNVDGIYVDTYKNGINTSANITVPSDGTLAIDGHNIITNNNLKTINNQSIIGSGNINISGGTTYTEGNGISIINDTISIDSSVVATQTDISDMATQTWVGNQGYLTSSALTNYVTTDTVQDISGRKTFLGEKAIYFKQQATSNKLGFTLYNPSNTELAALEYRPNTISGASLLALNCPQTTGGYVGFRYWGTPAVNIVAPKVATAGNYFMATHITDGTNTVTANNQGTINISTLLPDVSNYVTNTSLATTLADYVTNSTLTTTLADYALMTDIPTKTSDLTNDSDFATVSQIPTNNNQLTNGAGYITNSALNGYATETYVDTGLTTKQDVLTEGSGISIVAAGSTQTLPLAQTLPLEIINNTVQIYNNIDTSNALTVVIEVPYGANMAITPRIDDYYCIGVRNNGSGLYFYDTFNIGQDEYNSILIPTSGTNAYYVKFVIYSDSTSDVFYSLDNSNYTLALDKTRTNQKFEYGSALYLYEGGVSTYNMIMAAYGTDIVATSTISCDSTIARVTDIPTNNNQLTNGAGYITSSALNGYATENFVTSQGYITGITSGDVTTALGYTPYNSTNPNGYITSSALNGYAKTADLADVATSGSYNDLSDKPTIPAAQVNADWNATSGVAQILNKPTIPAVGNGTVTINQGGTQKGTFTLNQSGNVTINLDAGGSTDSDVFIAEYGTTTFAEVTNALNEGKVVLCKHTDSVLGNVLVPYTGTNANSHLFIYTRISDYNVIRLNRANDSWVESSTTILTGITSSDVITALGYTPYNAANPNGYITASALNGYAKTADLATVATSGSYNDLTDKPTIPTNNNQLTNGAGYITNSALNGYATQTWVGQQGYITDVINALGFTPADRELENITSMGTLISGEFDNVYYALDTKANTDLSNLSTTGQAVIDSKVSKSDIWYDSTSSTLYIGVTQ